jgi:hypothetical protein
MIQKSEMKAPSGNWRVIGVDTFDGEDWIIGDFPCYDEAIIQADANGGNMRKTHVYDDQGNHLYEAGKF